MNREQMEAARSAMSAWLAYPDELGKTPARIECAGTFELHGMRYYIFKYKKGLLGKWLWGVCGGYVGEGLEHCGHVFSEMEEYNPAGAEERAVEIADYIIENNATVRQTAKQFRISKSTVHKDVTERLLQINPTLAREARKVLDTNKSERHIRGGMATREKYLHQHG